MSRKKTPKSKGGSAPATSALPATHGSRPVRPGTARPGPDAPPNGPPQPGRSSLGGGGDFYDVAFKVMLVGDSGVGKTCLLVRFKDGAFLAGTFISTVGIDFRNKVLDVDGMKVKLQIWDTAGQERFRSVTHAYYRDAHGVLTGPLPPALLLLYDVTNKASFDSIQAWLTEIQEYAQHDVVLMLLGNKEYGLPFMETSAKTGLNVDLAFMAIAKELKQRCMKAPSEPRFQLHDYVKREGRGASCCKP
ncbi:ras-related protein Rab-26 isoform X4 [Balaenoptera acutorostrata]|uniref:small monomeric GTPase n=1 Tax=Balaenoptera acutorostrata TaxID=9767 RepID=A0A384A2Y9_BALAC|nr:ras-related protein Rab-26 isoform X4 [Balaenoptera acutorostrata]